MKVPATHAETIRQAIQSMGNMDREVANEIPKMPKEDLVILGQRLWWLIKRATRTLDPIKARFRELAIQQASGVAGNQRFEATDGSHCIVVIQNVTPVVRKDSDMAKLRASIGDVLFDQCFDTVTVYKPKKNIQELVAGMPPDNANSIMSILDMADGTPKVMFKD